MTMRNNGVRRTVRRENRAIADDGVRNARTSVARAFVGDGGLRAGWSALLFSALVASFGLVAYALVRFVLHLQADSSPIAPLPDMLQETMFLGALYLATLVMARIEKRSVLSYGFRDARMLGRLISGTVVGFLVISALVGLLWLTGSLAFDGQMLRGVSACRYAALWLADFLVVGIFEEGLLRGYLQVALARGLGFWGAAAVLSVLFGVLHIGNGGETPIGIINTIIAGIVLCLGLRLTGSLWWIVGVHTGFDVAESYFYGTPDSGLSMQGHLFATHPVGNALWSGGTAGPEASVYAFGAFLLMAAGIWLRWGTGASRSGSRAERSVPA